MAWKTVQYKLTSSAPLIQHNGQLADPLNKWTIAIKAITSKRKKTEVDHEEVAHLEFLGGLYMAESGPVIPADMIEAVIVGGARKSKEGVTAESGCFCLKHASLEYDGPRTANELWADERFRLYKRVSMNGRNSVMRMRPIFREWTATITLNIEDTLIDIARVDQWLDVAGAQIGMGDWHPQHGRFTAERLNGKQG